jgi:small subunit ribosomal protein S13
LEDKSKPDESIPEKPSDDSIENKKEPEQIKPETETKDKEVDSTEKIEEEQKEPEKEIQEKTVESEDKKEEKPIETKEQKEEKPVKTEKKKDDKKKKSDKDPDFKYIIRLSNTDIDGEKTLLYGLTSIKGIGLHMASLIAENVGINKHIKVGDLKDPQIEKLQEMIDNITNIAPIWMLNHRKDYETGEDIHLVSTEIEMKLRDEINIMKKIRSYRGIRHERGLPVRGQRTRANNRKGLALGVSKKKVQSGK